MVFSAKVVKTKDFDGEENETCRILTGAAITRLVDMAFAPVFAAMFAWDVYGVNRGYFYFYDVLSDEQIRFAFLACAVEFVADCMSALLFWYIVSRRFSPSVRSSLLHFAERLFHRYFYVLTLSIGAAAGAAGQCMVMMHDGMDLSFKFCEWQSDVNWRRCRVSRK